MKKNPFFWSLLGICILILQFLVALPWDQSFGRSGLGLALYHGTRVFVTFGLSWVLIKRCQAAKGAVFRWVLGVLAIDQIGVKGLYIYSLYHRDPSAFPGVVSPLELWVAAASSFVFFLPISVVFILLGMQVAQVQLQKPFRG